MAARVAAAAVEAKAQAAAAAEAMVRAEEAAVASEALAADSSAVAGSVSAAAVEAGVLPVLAVAEPRDRLAWCSRPEADLSSDICAAGAHGSARR